MVIGIRMGFVVFAHHPDQFQGALVRDGVLVNTPVAFIRLPDEVPCIAPRQTAQIRRQWSQRCQMLLEKCPLFQERLRLPGQKTPDIAFESLAEKAE